ncbi:MAG: outer membrane beta-barrel protein [Bacteroidia bacterium]|nr:outer membrane beta-barrel protein [Bacteroidia bacterium]
MKKYFFLLIAALLGSSAQSQNLGGGLVVGFNASQVDGDDFRGFNKAGLSLGGFVTYPINDRFSFQPEILVEQLGSANQQQLIVQTTHADVPLLLNITVPIELGETTQEIQVVAGPVIGVLLRAKDFNVDITNNLKRVDYRATAGIIYRMGRFGLGIRYGYSLNTFAKGTSNIGLFLTGPYHHYVNFSLRWFIAESRN